MQFSKLVKAVQNYVRMQDDDSKFNIEVFVNESIQEFIREDEWEKLQFSKKFTTDGSDQYSISTIILDPLLDSVFESEIALIDEGNIDAVTPLSPNEVAVPFRELQKIGFPFYIQEISKGGKYSILGDILHVVGSDRELTFIYSGPGIPFPPYCRNR